MLKSILNLEGVQEISKIEQKTVNGGNFTPMHGNCGPGEDFQCYAGSNGIAVCDCVSNSPILIFK